MQMFKKLLFLLTSHERKRAVLLLCMILVMSILDMMGVASIIPFISVLANPDLVHTNTFLNEAYTKLRFEDPQQFLFALGILVFVLLLVSLSFKAITTYAQLRFIGMREYSISKCLVEGYLHQPYSWFINRHSADIGKTILSEVGIVIDGALAPMITLISQSAVTIVLLILLAIVDYKLLLIIGLVLIAIYALIFKISRNVLVRIGVERLKANQRRFTVISEAFGAFKEVKVGGLEQVYIQRFLDPSYIFARYQAIAQIISQLPRFLLEVIAFGGMLVVVLYLMVRDKSFVGVVPIISLYIFSGYRLMPALHQIYLAVTQLRFARPALDALHVELMGLQPTNLNSSQDDIVLSQAITLNQIRYRYPNAPKVAIKDLNLIIPAKSTVGLVGETGSGKTTTVDLILGLLQAQQGTLEVNGQVINKHNCRAWQRTIGYVPQQIYLSDDTVAANIAFGLDPKNIDQDAVERSAKIANLHDFVVNELSQQYQSTLGERGVRLSGGQRQRIGIARALYHNPQLLIMDEATNALDNLTEQAVMEAVHNLENKITIILIAHRLNTVKTCDTIFLLEKGELKAQGTFADLTLENKTFQKISLNHKD
jgi:ABC-type bacteriocin/lantibiotic exporter with double-glycine peptidase domain